jgi:hypothetical protein
MREAKRHQVTAMIFDMYVVGSIVQIPLALITVIGKFSSAWVLWLVVGGICMVGLIVYHIFFARKAHFCTPGETMAGATMRGENKIWQSVFRISRWFLFLSLFLLLLYPGNAFDSIWEQPWTGARLAGTTISTLLFVYAAFKIAVGEFMWVIAPSLLLGIQMVFAIFTQRFPQGLRATIIGMHGGTLLFLFIAIAIYSSKRIEQDWWRKSREERLA